MASELRVNTLKDASGNNSIGMSYVAEGSAKAWMQAVCAGTSYNDSFNTSSLTDVGTGNIRVTYTNNMSNDDSSLTIGHQYTGTGGTGAYFANAGAMTTSTHEHAHYENAALKDPVKYDGTIHGDLA